MVLVFRLAGASASPASAKPMSRAFAALCVAALCGCVDETASISPAAPQTQNIAARPGVSPRAASVAFTSFEGLPGSYAQRFNAALIAQAKARDITVADSRSAKYLVRGYLGIGGGEGGTTVSYVWDVFDHGRHRAQRVEDTVAVGAATADPWSRVDDQVLQGIASKSADELAAFLTNTPEALADDAPASTGTAASAGADAAPVARTRAARGDAASGALAFAPD